MHGLESIKPRVHNAEGLEESTEGITEFEKLPKAAQEYLRFQERESGARIGMVSTGPDRDQTMILPEFAAALDEFRALNRASYEKPANRPCGPDPGASAKEGNPAP